MNDTPVFLERMFPIWVTKIQIQWVLPWLFAELLFFQHHLSRFFYRYPSRCVMSAYYLARFNGMRS